VEIGLAAHPPAREGGLKAIREKVEEPSPGQPHVLARQREASRAGRATGWERHRLVTCRSPAENVPAFLLL